MKAQDIENTEPTGGGARFPEVDTVAVAIVEAARSLGANPIAIAAGKNGAAPGCPPHYEISRARAYAAFAIQELFPECGSVAIGRMVGAGSPSCYLTNLNYQIARCALRWWDDDIADRVIAAARKNCDRGGAKQFYHREKSIVSELMGDPPPGRSALDERGRA